MPDPLPPDQLALLKQAREANLLKQWAGGRKLSREELAEIRHLLPPDENADKPDAPPLELDADGPRVVGRKVVYPRKLEEYAPDYGLDPTSGTRTLKRWIAIGKDADPVDLPPLHRPDKMPEWGRVE